MKILLGSSSPRRLEILSMFFQDITVISPHIDESILPGESPREHVTRLALQKSMSIDKVLACNKEKALLITSDTIVSIENEILGKPSGHDDAIQMLTQLSGKTHKVISGVTLAFRHMGDIRRITGSESTDVIFNPLDHSRIEKYLSLIHYRDKAGSYAIQDHGDIIIREINGSYSNVIGFPLRLFWKMTLETGIIDWI
ncbi:MAG: Maf family protein [Spirochaetota bacterium]